MKKIFLPIILWFLIPDLIFGQNKLLRLSLKPGFEYRTETSTLTVMNQRVMGNDQVISIDMLLVTDSRVKSFSDSLYFIEYRYRTLKMETTSPGYSTFIDTDDGENIESELMRVIINKPFTLIINSRGIIQDVKDIEVLFNNIDTDIRLDSAIMTEFKNSLYDSFGKETFIRNMQQHFVHFPKEEVKKGDVWTYHTSSSTANMNVTLLNIVSLKNIGKEQILIRASSDISTPGNELTNINGFPGMVNLAGDAIRELILDPETCLSKESTISQELKGSIRFKPEPNSDQLMTIPTAISLKSTSVIIDL